MTGASGVGLSRVRGWLLCCLLACMGGWAVADDDEPGFDNFAQLAAITVGGVAANYPVGALSDDPLRVTVPSVSIGHCAPQRITVRAWQPNNRQHVVQALGQTLYLNDVEPTGTLDAAPLAFGANVVELQVRRYLSAGYYATAFYTLNIERAGPGTNAALAALALSSGTLSPPFDPAVTSYSATVEAPSVAVAPTAADCPQLAVNGQPVASGGAVQVPLALGPNLVAVQSTAQDGTVRTYQLTLTRAASANADLQGLALSAGTLSPAFDSGVAHYTAAVPYAASVAVTPTPAASTATLTVNGAPAAAGVPHAVALQAGVTAISVGVLAEDGSASRTYTVDVTRAAPDTNARLSALALSAGTLGPAFDPDVLLYAASVANAVDAVDVTPTPAFPGATVAVNGTPVVSGGAVRVPLAQGLNTIAVQATAQDGTTRQTTTLRVTRAGLVNSARLLGLQLSSGTPWPPVHPATAAYTARAASGAATLALTPTTEDASATVLVNGTPVASGEASAPLPLAPGHNPFTIQITSTDGLQTASYTLAVLRGTADAALAGLTLSGGALAPAFDPAVLAYGASVPYTMSSVRVGLALADAEATARVGARVLRSGHAAAVALAPGLNTVPVRVTSSDGTAQRTYVLSITRQAPQAVLAHNSPQFGAPQDLALTGQWGAALAADDLDGDGQADALALEHGLPELAVLQGRGDGSLDAAQWLPLGIEFPVRLATGDVHGDGWPDVLAVGTYEAQLAVGTGAGRGAAGLAPRPLALPQPLWNQAATVLLDVDGDGRDDLVSPRASQGVAVLRSLGDGGFAAAQPAGTLAQVQHVLGHDIDGDGQLDLLLANPFGALQWLPGEGGGSFGAPRDVPLHAPDVSALWASPRLADVDGDGRADLIVAASPGGVSTVLVLKGLAGGGFASPVRHASGLGPMIGEERPLDLAVADFNGDGHPDIAVLNGSGGYHNVSILAGQGNGSFAAPVPHYVPWLPSRMVVADFDGDGKPDLLLDAAMGQGGGLKLLRNTAPDLALVQPSSGTLSPAFTGGVTEYTVQLPPSGPSLALTPWLAFGTATVRIDGVPVASGSASASIAVPPGGSVTITASVQAHDGSTRSYTFTATRAMPDHAVTATASPAQGGAASCAPNPVAHGGHATCTATASAGYGFTGWTGACAGQGAGCTLAGVTAVNTSVAQFAQPQHGQCGGANGASFTGVPTIGLCSAGMVSGMTGSGPWNWTCKGTSGGIDASCSASLASYAVTVSGHPVQGGMATCSPGTVVHGGNATCTATASTGYGFTGWTGACVDQGASCTLANVTAARDSVAQFAQNTLTVPEGPQAGQPLAVAVQPVNGWQLTQASTQTAANLGVALPAGVTLPHGVVRLWLESGIQGSQATVVLTYPQSLPTGTVYYKYGKTQADPQPHWYVFPGAQVSGNTVTLTLTDGGAGDDDLVRNSAIDDPGGPVLVMAPPSSPVSIPILGEWALVLLVGLLGLFSLGTLRRL